MWRRWVDKRTG